MPTSQLGYRPALDGLRALAIAPVVGLHAFGWPGQGGGSLGVDLFFVLSGFLITTLLLDERQRAGTVSLRAFYRRRAARLVPGLVLMLAIYTAVTHGAQAWGVLFGGTYTTNFAIIAAHEKVPWSLGHLWSLAQEEQFYLLWPPLLLLIARVRVRLLAPVLVGLLAAGLLEKITLAATGSSLNRLWFGPDTHSDPILIGCLLAVCLSRGMIPSNTVHSRARLAIASLVAVIICLVTFSHVEWLVATTPLRMMFAIACSGLILGALNGGAIAQLLSLQPFVLVGRISYSLYLWHVPLLAAVGANAHGPPPAGRAIVAVAAAVVAAAISFFVFEQPLRERWRRRPERLTLPVVTEPA